MKKPKSYWNYRVVAEFQDNKKKILRSWFFSIRDVFYTDDKPTSWGAEPQYPVGESGMDVHDDIDNMSKAVFRPLLIVQGNKLVEHHRKCAALIKSSDLKSYENK